MTERTDNNLLRKYEYVFVRRFIPVVFQCYNKPSKQSVNRKNRRVAAVFLYLRL